MAEVKKGTSGNDCMSNEVSGVVNGLGGNDTLKNSTGNVTISGGAGNDDLGNYYGNNVTIDAGTGNDTIENYSENATICGGTGYSPQQVIKNLVKAWSQSHLFSDKDKLDESIKLCSHFKGIQDVIDHMIADCKKAGDGDTFLRKYCGIITDNSDTGAITGWDAGGLTYKTKKHCPRSHETFEA